MCTLVLSLVMSKDLINRFGEFLAVLLYLVTPWTAINLVDFYIVRKGHYSIREIFNPNGMYRLHRTMPVARFGRRPRARQNR